MTERQAGTGDDGSAIFARLADIVGTANVLRAEADLEFYSQDIFSQGIRCAAVVRPSSIGQVSALAPIVGALGYDLVSRGGGMSYTSGYLPQRAQTVVIDLGGLDRIVEVNETDMYVTVEAGCTWAVLRSALAGTGLRTPYWGPLSGLRSTIGGALSQNSVFFGSGIHGTAADSVIGLTVVRVDGSIVTTGSASGSGANAFSRHYGPDLTGLFTGDAGAFGVKVAATFRLIKRKPVERHVSFSFESRAALLAAMHGIAREGLATECFAFDPFLQSVRMKRADLVSDVKVLAAVMQGQGSVHRGLKEGLKMAFAGRRFAEKVAWPLHVTLEDRSEAAADAVLDDVRRIGRRSGGKEIENTVPKAVHALPFGPLNGMVGVEGERWVPVHGVLPNSRVSRFCTALDGFYDTHRPEMQRLDVTSGYLITAVGPGATLIEPVFYWPDALMEVHRRSVTPDFLAKLPRHDANPNGMKFVQSLRSAVIDLFVAHGATHFQAGRTYPLRQTREAGTGRLLDELKQVLDPVNRLNPGTLGLGS